MNLHEEVVSSQRLYEGKVVNLRVDTVRLHNGKTGKREVVEHGGAVAVVPLLSDGTVLLIRQFRLPTNGTLLEVVAGGMEEGEDPTECARREMAEEIGMVPGKLTHLCTAYVAPGYCTEKIYCYLAEDLTPHQEAPDEGEVIETVPMTLADAVAAIASGTLCDMKSIAALLATARLKGVM
jgi:ADP-ribose pyrophosphatase